MKERRQGKGRESSSGISAKSHDGGLALGRSPLALPITTVRWGLQSVQGPSSPTMANRPQGSQDHRHSPAEIPSAQIVSFVKIKTWARITRRGGKWKRKKREGLWEDQQVGHRRPWLLSSWTKVRATRPLWHLLPDNTNPSPMAAPNKILGSDLVTLFSGTEQGKPPGHRSQESSASVGL